MKLTNVLLVGLMAVSLQAKDVKQNPVELKVKAMVAEARKSVKHITPKELNSMIKAEKDFLLIDVREPAEVNSGWIDSLDLKKIPYGVLPFKSKAFKTDKKIVLYCKVGGRGSLATHMMQKLGFTNVYNLKGGIKGWLAAGYPVETKMGTFKLSK